MREMLIYPSYMEPALVAIIGLVFGSFVTMLSYRLPREEGGSLMGRSKCPKCGHILAVIDLFPVLSWVWMRGVCHYCKAKIAWRYPLIELAQASTFLLVYYKFGLTAEAILLMLLSVSLLAMIIIDFDFMIIPDELNIVMGVLGVVYAFLKGQLVEGVAYAAVGIFIGIFLRWIFYKWKKVESLGLGDVKFLGVAGLFLGENLFITFFFLAGVIGIVIAVLWRLAGKGRQFPFGPALAFSMFICVLVPEVQGAFREQVTQILLKYI